jgi:Tol biopolymer transport system component
MKLTMSRRRSPRTPAATPIVAAWLAPAVAGCLAPTGEATRPPPVVRLVVTERWAHGGRLVVVDDAGDRQAVLVGPPPGPPATVRDEQAAFSPDGRWIAFASTRGRDLAHTRLWLVAARVGAEPRPLTGGPGTDVSPAWTAGGEAIVFAGDRAGTFDLYRLAIDRETGLPRGAPVRLTDAPSHELAPTVAPDGRIAAQVIEPGLAPRSYLALVGDGGALEPLTAGPLDATPAWDPAGRRLAYTTRRLRADGGEDDDLVLLDTERDRPPHALAELVATDETGPVWSRDGRWLFATSIALGAERTPRWSSVIVLDLREPGSAPRMLRDRVGAIVRAGPALAPLLLDELALGRAPLYGAALATALRELDEREAARSAPPAP